MRCYTFLYTRKSTEEDDRQTLSLDAQEKECREYAVCHGIVLSELIREAHSARKPGRPLFQAMVTRAEELRAQGVAVRILCHKPDRLLRNLADWARLNDLMDAGVECLFVTGSYPSNAQGKMAFGINVLFAKYYVDNLSEEVKKGLKEKLARGEWPGPAPLGYRNDKRRIELDPERAPLVQRAFQYYASGEYSLATLAQQLHQEGLTGRQRGKAIAKSTLQDQILTNPFYCGLLRYRGELHLGSHPPLVTTTLFEQVQSRLQGKAQPKRRRHQFRYAGLLCCHNCGCAVVGDMKKGYLIYYRCSHRRGACSEGYIRQELLGATLQQTLTQTLTLPPWAVAELQAAADRLVREEEQGRGGGRETVERELQVIERKLTTLLDLHLAGHLGQEEYLTRRALLVRDQARLREGLTAFELPRLDPREAVNRFIHTCNSLGALLKRGTDAEVRQLLQTLGSNYQLGGGTVTFEPVEPYTIAPQVQNRPTWLGWSDVIRTICQAYNKIPNQQEDSATTPPTDDLPLAA
jgi:site-specific DNA recombinase